eukprot:scaffold7219_cov129-Isochrysis_galbana.AAC.1
MSPCHGAPWSRWRRLEAGTEIDTEPLRRSKPGCLDRDRNRSGAELYAAAQSSSKYTIGRWGAYSSATMPCRGCARVTGLFAQKRKSASLRVIIVVTSGAGPCRGPRTAHRACAGVGERERRGRLSSCVEAWSWAVNRKVRGAGLDWAAMCSAGL